MDPKKLVSFIRSTYRTIDFIPLHAPTFSGNESAYVQKTIESTFVSSVGSYVDSFEEKIEAYTDSAKAVAVVNGTAALSTALYMAGVKAGDLVVTQALTFVATCNALHHMKAEPIFIDVSKNTLGLCPERLEGFLNDNARVDERGCYLIATEQKISAVVPMHTFGHPVQIDQLMAVCDKWRIPLVEDAAESLGSFYKGQHTGTFGAFSALSFNGNKIITTGGGGAVLCKDNDSGIRAKHITTTAKIPHPYEFNHDEPGFNYRLPNLNAALGCAQLESLPKFLKQKRRLANHYQQFFENTELQFISEPKDCVSSYWLNAVICENAKERNALIKYTNSKDIMTRPVWKLMHRLPMFENCLKDDLVNSVYFESRLLNIPSSPVEI